MPAFSEFASMALNQTARNGSPSHSPARPRLPSISEVRPHEHSPSIISQYLSQTHLHARQHSHSHPEDDAPAADVKRHLRLPRSRTPWTGNGYSISRAQSSGIAEVDDEAGDEITTKAEAESEGRLLSLVVDSHRRPDPDSQPESQPESQSHHSQNSSTSLASYIENHNSPFTTNPHSKSNSAESDALPSFASLEHYTKSRSPPSWSDEALLFKLSGLSRPYRQAPGSGSSSSNNLDPDRMPSLLHHLNTSDCEVSVTDRELMHRRTASAPQPMEPFDPHSSRADRAASRAARAPVNQHLTPQVTPDKKFSNIEVNGEEVLAHQRSSSLYHHNPSPAMPRTPYSRSPDQAPASLVPFEPRTVQTAQPAQPAQPTQNEHHHRQSIESNDSEPNFFELGNFRDVSEADGDKCVFVNYCGTGSKPRKAISHFFGRNKTCTRQIREYVWVHWCRKHYQRTRYEQKANYPLRQAKLLRAQIERVQIWGDQNRAAGRGPVLMNWTLALRKREQDRIDALKKKDKQERADMALGKRKREDEYSHESSLPVKDANGYSYDDVDLDDIPTHAPEWLLEYVGREYDTPFLLQLIDRIEGEINKGALPMIPDIEMLPNFEDPADTSSKKKKPTKRRQTTARRTPLGHRQTQSVSGPIMHSAAHAHSHGPAPSSSFDYRQPYPQQPAFSQPHYQSHQPNYSHAEGYNWHASYGARPEHSSHAHAHNRYHSMGNLALAPSSGSRLLPAMDASSFDRPQASSFDRPQASSFDRPQHEHGYPPAFDGESREVREPRERAHQRSQSEAVSRMYPGHAAYTSERRTYLPPLHTMSPSDMRPASPQSLLRHARHHSTSSHMSMPGPSGHDGVDDRDERPHFKSVHA